MNTAYAICILNEIGLQINNIKNNYSEYKNSVRGITTFSQIYFVRLTTYSTTIYLL